MDRRVKLKESAADDVDESPLKRLNRMTQPPSFRVGPKVRPKPAVPKKPKLNSTKESNVTGDEKCASPTSPTPKTPTALSVTIPSTPTTPPGVSPTTPTAITPTSPSGHSPSTTPITISGGAHIKTETVPCKPGETSDVTHASTSRQQSVAGISNRRRDRVESQKAKKSPPRCRKMKCPPPPPPSRKPGQAVSKPDLVTLQCPGSQPQTTTVVTRSAVHKNIMSPEVLSNRKQSLESPCDDTDSAFISDRNLATNIITGKDKVMVKPASKDTKFLIQKHEKVVVTQNAPKYAPGRIKLVEKIMVCPSEGPKQNTNSALPSETNIAQRSTDTVMADDSPEEKSEKKRHVVFVRDGQYLDKEIANVAGSQQSPTRTFAAYSPESSPPPTSTPMSSISQSEGDLTKEITRQSSLNKPCYRASVVPCDSTTENKPCYRPSAVPCGSPTENSNKLQTVLKQNLEQNANDTVTTSVTSVSSPVTSVTTSVTSLSTPLPKPVIEVHLVKKGKTLPSVSKTRMSKSVEDLERDIILNAVGTNFNKGKSRSSFMDENAPVDSPNVSACIYDSIGDVQTMMKHAKDEKGNEYCLPQPQCYSEDTIKAVKKITEKYDTFQRMKLHALSFRDGTVRRAAPPATETNQTDGSRDEPDSTANSGTPQLDEAFEETVEEVVSLASGLTKKDRARLDLFYRGNGTDVTVCGCLADMYLGTNTSDDDVTDLKLKHTGVPLLVFNKGGNRRKRELFIILAERETGFSMFRDKFNYLSKFREVAPEKHRLNHSGSLSVAVQLEYYSQTAAAEFISKFKEITSDPKDDIWKLSSEKVEKKSRKLLRTKSKSRPAQKGQISQPCNFSHVTRVDPHDVTLAENFSSLVSKAKRSAAESFRKPRLRSSSIT